ncbi:MAG: MBOAT family protein [Ferruginibacter sp.]|nr:MBOAT family protein [Ferruginibacter sp.]
MLFTSFAFFILLVLTFVIYYLPFNFFKKANTQLLVLILSSVIFYGYYAPELLFLLAFSGAVNVLTSYYVSFGAPKHRMLLATAGIVINLVVLAFFKYSPLIAGTFFNTDNGIGFFLLTIPLPIGISFFTFEGISLVIDTYKGHTDDKFKNLVDKSFKTHIRNSFFFIVFFPHLVSGPILKAHDFIPQISNKFFKDIDWEYCFKMLVVGYFLKLVVADNLKDFTSSLVYPGFMTLSTLTLASMLLGYSFQIFADFAGYSLIALGLAGLFGYRLMQNFNFPYISTTFSEFWRRWHISLSTFLKEYLYFPLGGNKKGKVRTYINLTITMVLGGLWHGAAWSYAVWGAFHGLALAIERLFNDKFKIAIKPNSFFYYFKILFVFLSVSLAWLLFKLPNFDQVIMYMKALFTNTGLVTNYISVFLILLYSFPVVLYHIFYLKRQAKPAFFNKLEYAVYGVMLFLIFTNSGTPGTFIYFQF